MTRVIGPVALVVGLLGSVAVTAADPKTPAARDTFPHDKHAKLFPECTTCHQAAVDPNAPLWPRSADCATCHDGVIEERVEWEPRDGPRPANLKFDHLSHVREAIRRTPADSVQLRSCSSCHNEVGATRMAVRPPLPDRCVGCHTPATAHLAVADTACATCHVTLANARLLTRERIKQFPKPPSHEKPDFSLAGHGSLAAGWTKASFAVAPSCATCHARDFCIACHVNGPEVKPIQALAPDPRSLVFEAKLEAPTSHARADFLRRHGSDARRQNATCAACHAQPSCLACHAGTPPKPVTRLAMPGPGRGVGAVIERTKPVTHTFAFTNQHAADANARPETCQACHVRPACLECHRPDGASRGAYHAQGFASRHQTAAYNREATCSDCHNPAQFCQSCHQQAGLTAVRRLGAAGFHDAQRAFIVGHGQAARQNLESCASCHAERDCTSCHSAVAGGFRFNPHGPGFNPDRLRRKNPSVCVACHGTAVPGLTPPQ